MNLFKKKTSVIRLDAPLSGHVKTLESLKDGVFSEKLLGEGCVITSDEEMIIAPCDGTLVMETETKHAIGFVTHDGIELLIHIGLDTVMMNGKGFEMKVKKDEKVKKGQCLMTFSKAMIKQAGYTDDVIIIVSNTRDFQSVDCNLKERISRNEVLIKITK